MLQARNTIQSMQRYDKPLPIQFEVGILRESTGIVLLLCCVGAASKEAGHLLGTLERALHRRADQLQNL